MDIPYWKNAKNMKYVIECIKYEWLWSLVWTFRAKMNMVIIDGIDDDNNSNDDEKGGG